ncbi:MAG: HipA family kinase [Chthoniobacterales bacterium]
MKTPEPVEIVEVLGRANAGVSTKPFKCRGEDGGLYYVKLGNSNVTGLQAEWIAGNLAKSMALPVADFALVQVTRELAESLPNEHRELGHGIGFGSLSAPVGSRELQNSDVGKPQIFTTLAQLLAFDAWVQNEDRKLGSVGGNPNALWLAAKARPLLLIDHDNAFDPTFEPSTFLDNHLARRAITHWFDVGHRAAWTEIARSAAELVPAIWESLPESWLFDTYGDPTPSLNCSVIESILARPFSHSDEFWHLLTSS